MKLSTSTHSQVVSPSTSRRRNTDYNTLRDRLAGTLKAIAGEAVLIHLPISARTGSPERAVKMFMQAVDHSQTYNCRCCHRFIQDTYDLALLFPDGKVESIWSRVVPPGTFVDMVHYFTSWAYSVPTRPTKTFPRVYKSRRVDTLAGRQEEGGFEHFYAENPRNMEHVQTANNIFINKGEGGLKEDTQLVLETLSWATTTMLTKTKEALHSSAVSRIIPTHRSMVDHWLTFVADMSRLGKAQTFWPCAAAAVYRGEDFIHFKNSLPGQLLEDLKSMSMPRAIAAYNKRCDPLAYQRPKVVKMGNIAKADKLFKELGLEESLLRRHGNLSDVDSYLVWRPDHKTYHKRKPDRMSTAAGGGAFSESLLASPPLRRSAPGHVQHWTMSKFMRQVMPVTKTLDIRLPVRGGFYGLTAPSLAHARPLVRYPGGVAWYTYNSATHATQWGIQGGAGYYRLVGIMPFPSDWGKPTPGRGWMFLVETPGAPMATPGLCLFPEFLVPEVREVRSAIEAYSNNNKLGGRVSLVALTLGPDGGLPVKLKEQGGQEYELTYD